MLPPNSILVLSVAVALLVGGCAHTDEYSEANQVGMSEKDYRKLERKAEGGDWKAAEKLAELWYMHGSSNDRAKYWLAVAAQHGSKRAKKLQEQL